VGSVELLDVSLVATHLWNECVLSSDLRRVRNSVAGGVLKWEERSAVDVLALGEDIWKFSSGSLVSVEPAESMSSWAGCVFNSHGNLLSCGVDAAEVDNKSLTDVGVVSADMEVE